MSAARHMYSALPKVTERELIDRHVREEEEVRAVLMQIMETLPAQMVSGEEVSLRDLFGRERGAVKARALLLLVTQRTEPPDDAFSNDVKQLAVDWDTLLAETKDYREALEFCCRQALLDPLWFDVVWAFRDGDDWIDNKVGAIVSENHVLEKAAHSVMRVVEFEWLVSVASSEELARAALLYVTEYVEGRATWDRMWHVVLSIRPRGNRAMADEHTLRVDWAAYDRVRERLLAFLAGAQSAEGSKRAQQARELILQHKS